MEKFALIGKPNSGKSSLFNLLTGLNQKIGNYGGVTVERKTGEFQGMELLDLPGLRSLRANTLEEKIARDAALEYAHSGEPLIFVANGLQLEDNLILFSEIADLQVPMIIVINFKDDLEKNNIKVSIDKLSDHLGCHVVLMNSRNGDGLDTLKALIQNNQFALPNAFSRSLYDKLENGSFENKYVSSVESDSVGDKELEENDYRRRKQVIHEIIKEDVQFEEDKEKFLNQSKKLDKILLHPIFGILIFLGTILLVFQSVFFLANYPMDWIDSGFAILGEWANNNIAVEWIADIVSNGVIPGLAGVLIFIPQIAILFLLLGILEHSGYLSRISFIANRFLSNFGLTGQSVIPLMSSWACAIPAIMSSRVVNDPKERLAIIFASPLMTCSARLPVYTILIAIMIPGKSIGFFNIQGMTLMLLYIIGVIATLVIAMLVSRRSNIEGNKMWSLELPVYRIPNWRNVFYNVYIKTKAFVVEAGKIIFMVSILLWLLASFSPRNKHYISEAYEIEKIRNENITIEAIELEYSYAGYLGKIIEPVIEPLGYDWKIGIALISSFAAREVFVGSISTIYSVGSDDNALIKERLQREINLKTGENRYNLATCISLLMFYVFALQCMSTMAIVRKETGNWSIPVIQFIVMLVLAYIFAFIAFRLFS